MTKRITRSPSAASSSRMIGHNSVPKTPELSVGENRVARKVFRGRAVLTTRWTSIAYGCFPSGLFGDPPSPVALDGDLAGRHPSRWPSSAIRISRSPAPGRREGGAGMPAIFQRPPIWPYMVGDARTHRNRSSTGQAHRSNQALAATFRGSAPSSCLSPETAAPSSRASAARARPCAGAPHASSIGATAQTPRPGRPRRTDPSRAATSSPPRRHCASPARLPGP